MTDKVMAEFVLNEMGGTKFITYQVNEDAGHVWQEDVFDVSRNNQMPLLQVSAE